VVYADNLFSRSLFNDFQAQALSQGIQILNDLQMLPDSSASWTDDVLDPVLKDLHDSEARVIVPLLFAGDIPRFIVRMHELGYSDAHYTYIAVGWLEQSLVQGDKTSPAYNATSEAILREALRGSLMFFPASFVGSFGERSSRSSK
jgi:hypothetical protein